MNLAFCGGGAYKTPMNAQPHLVDTPVARELVHAGSVRAAEVIPTQGGWLLALHVGLERRILRLDAGLVPRVFRKLETVTSYARDRLGLARLEIDMQTRWENTPQKVA